MWLIGSQNQEDVKGANNCLNYLNMWQLHDVQIIELKQWRLTFMLLLGQGHYQWLASIHTFHLRSQQSYEDLWTWWKKQYASFFFTFLDHIIMKWEDMGSGVAWKIWGNHDDHHALRDGNGNNKGCFMLWSQTLDQYFVGHQCVGEWAFRG